MCVRVWRIKLTQQVGQSPVRIHPINSNFSKNPFPFTQRDTWKPGKALPYTYIVPRNRWRWRPHGDRRDTLRNWESLCSPERRNRNGDRRNPAYNRTGPSPAGLCKFRLIPTGRNRISDRELYRLVRHLQVCSSHGCIVHNLCQLCETAIEQRRYSNSIYEVQS